MCSSYLFIYFFLMFIFFFKVVNPYLLKDLHDRNLWNENLISELVNNMGSIQVIY